MGSPMKDAELAGGYILITIKMIQRLNLECRSSGPCSTHAHDDIIVIVVE